MKAYKKSLTESQGSRLRKILGFYRERGIMSMEQGMLKLEVLNIIARHFLFNSCCLRGIMNREQGILKFEVLDFFERCFLFIGSYRRAIMNREQGMLKFEVLNGIVRYFLFNDCYGFLKHEDMKARRYRENKVSIISMIPGKSSIRNTLKNLFFPFMECCSGKINMVMMRRNPQAMGGCYKWTRENAST